MWIIGFNTGYYPYILTFKDEQKAKEEYEYLKSSKNEEETVYLAEVKEFDGDIEFED